MEASQNQVVTEHPKGGVSPLKEHKILVNDKPHIIEVPKIDKKTPFSVVIDGKTCQVEFLNEPESGQSFLIKINGTTYKVELHDFHLNKPFFVRVNNKPYKVQYEPTKTPQATSPAVEPSLPMTSKRPLKTPIIGKENAVTAPMPGIVVSLKVKVGDSVSPGQPICVLEAMKMENEIAAPRAGVVKEIKVSEGSSVSQGEPIIIIK
jgi:biotin carboxyl carrier protein